MSALFWAERDFRKVLESINDAIAIVRGKEVLFSNRAFDLLDAPGLPFVPGYHTHKKKDGTSVYFEIVGAEVSNFKGHPATVLTIRDVTSQRALDARLRLTDRMVAVGTLAAGAAHEINNPLAYLLANLTFLEEGLRALASGDPRAAELTVAVGDAKDGARRIENIVRDLRTFSSTRDSGVDRGDPVRAVQATMSLLAHSLESKARVHVDINPVPEVKLGESRISHVLTGLLSNAKDAFPAADPKNEIRVRLYLSEDKNTVRIEVRDNGRGMTKDVLDRIFDPFFTTKDIGAGAGLGLFVAHNLVVSAGGTLTAESHIGDGSRFLISLPIAKASPGEFPMPVLPLRPRVLIGEPNKHVANAMRRLLGDYDVVVASTGIEAVEKCLSQEFDVILLEVAMPDLTAPEMQKRILDAKLPAEPRLVFMTQGGSGTMDLMLISTLGDAPIEKPFDVRAVVAKVLGRKT